MSSENDRFCIWSLAEPAFAIVSLFVGLVLLFYALATLPTGPAAEVRPGVGEAGVVAVPDKGPSLVGATYEDLQMGLEALRAKDLVGLQQLDRSGRAFELGTGTRVLALANYPTVSVVRVLEGPHEEEVAWVVKEHVRSRRSLRAGSPAGGRPGPPGAGRR